MRHIITNLIEREFAVVVLVDTRLGAHARDRPSLSVAPQGEGGSLFLAQRHTPSLRTTTTHVTTMTNDER